MLRNDWNRYRQDEDFQASELAVDMQEGMADSSEDEDAMENVPLKDRLKIRRAKVVMEQAKLAVQAHKAGSPSESGPPGISPILYSLMMQALS